MAISNSQRLDAAMTLLSEGLGDFVDEVMTEAQGADWNERAAREYALKNGKEERVQDKEDPQTQLYAIVNNRNLFKDRLSYMQVGWVSELIEARNNWAHRKLSSSEDTARTLDTIERLLRAVDANDSADDAQKIRAELQRSVYEDQTRHKANSLKVLTEQSAGLKPWREVIRPHEDVLSGNFNAAEFAADLHLVHTGELTSPEYADPVEFFNRTYITEGLRDLLTRALKRLSGDENASPVVNLQTNFGGGKTHSMLALYHLFSGTPITRFPQELQELIGDTGVDLESLDVKRVALVGTHISPAQATLKDDGTEINTLWGELAWQLGGREGYEVVRAADEKGVSPGDGLRDLFLKYGPAIILVDEWVAYARQLATDKSLPAGSFDTQFTFAQTLTEAAQSVPGTMVVISIPASDHGDEKSSNIEVGGENGQQALEALKNVIGRKADQWRPSSKDESFEIVRRRLFQSADAEGLKAIAATARSFVNFYRDNVQQFPRAVSEPGVEYENRIKASYPLHPELLDRLYEDWSTLERFQRTRGVLKLVSVIVYELWKSPDQSPMILPGNVPLDATTVSTDLTQYLEEQWTPIIHRDIDGPGSTAVRTDTERPNLGSRHLTQRIARTIFMGAAPRTKSTRKGVDKQNVYLGTAIPGDTLGNFGTALELLAQGSTYFYEEQGHYWFDTQPSVAKTAKDYAEQLREDEETVWDEITSRLQKQSRGQFERVHVAPESTGDIPETEELRLVIVHPRYSTNKRGGGKANEWVSSAVEMKGASQRINRNTLVFVAADRAELEQLEAATRTYLGWKMVQDTSEPLNLTPQQLKQTNDRVRQTDLAVQSRLVDTFIWCMYPEQPDPEQHFEIAQERLSGSSNASLAERVWDRLKRSDVIIPVLAPASLGGTLRRELGKTWQDRKEMAVGELWTYFLKYPYMPRLASRDTLDDAVAAAATTFFSQEDEFAVATGKSPETGSYQGLFVPPVDTEVTVTDSTLLVDADLAREQLSQRPDPDPEPGSGPGSGTGGGSGTGTGTGGGPGPTPPPPPPPPPQIVPPLKSRYYGSVRISADDYGRRQSSIWNTVVEHLIKSGAEVNLTLDIEATLPAGFSEDTMRVVRENAQTNGFSDNEFDE